MLLKLHGRQLRSLSGTSEGPFVARITERADLPDGERAGEILLVRAADAALPPGFRAYLLHRSPATTVTARDAYVLGSEMHYLAEGDVIRIEPRRHTLSVLYRRSSPSNSLLVTERCDNFCVMCSQPPKPHDDSWLIDDLLRVIPLMSTETTEIGITGGEPTLAGGRFIELLESLQRWLPSTAVHVLSNGRAFSDRELARQVAQLGHPDLMIGIPLYSDIAEEHDYVVQATGAYSQTIRGILNLKQSGVRVEIRVVVHAATYQRLPQLASFLTRNLLFVDHVALMGFELVGFGKTNVESLWVDPLDYQPQLVEATEVLDRAGMRVSVYNQQLCVLDPRIRPFGRKSISDWKTTYVDECSRCESRDACGGFFATGLLRRSRGIRPLATR